MRTNTGLLSRTLSSIRSSSSSSAILQQADSPWRLWLKIEEVRSTVGTVERKERRSEVKAGSEESEVKSRKFEPFPQEGDGQFCWLYLGLLFTLIESEDIRKQKFSGKVYTAINVTAIRLGAIDFTAFYCHRLHISEDYKNRPVGLFKTGSSGNQECFKTFK